MSGELNCLDGGLIVGTKYPMPEDPHLWYTDPKERMGCNSIHCNGCEVAVRHIDGYRLFQHSLPDQAAYEALYAASGSELTRHFRASPEYRAYFCRCSWADTFGFKEAPYVADGWCCAGHPRKVLEANQAKVAKDMPK